MNYHAALAILTVSVLISVATGGTLLFRAITKPKILPEEIAFGMAWVYVVGSLFWLGVYLTDSTFLGFGAPWSWLTSAHLAFAGYGALTITALSCRVVSNRTALQVLRVILILHPITYLVTAAGILEYRFCNEIGSSCYALIFASQLFAVLLGKPNRIDPIYLCPFIVALVVPVATMIPAVAWAWKQPFFNLDEMVQYHGIVNAAGHVGLGIFACVLGRPRSHSPSLALPQSDR